MKKALIFFCFFWPLISTMLRVQAFIGIFVTEAATRFFAYLNLVFIPVGLILIIKNTGKLSRTAGLWFVFFLLYFFFSIMANIFLERDLPILFTLPPVFFLLGFYYLLSIDYYRKLFPYVVTWTLTISSILTIILYYLKFDVRARGIILYSNRAAGVYGDANAAAIISIIAYIFLDTFFKPNSGRGKIFKMALTLAIFYSLLITYSTTGLSAFVIIFVVNNLKFFTPKRVPVLFIFFVAFIVLILNIKGLTNQLDLNVQQRAKVENFVNVITLNFDEVDNSGRGELVSELFESISENPILGNGPDFVSYAHGHNTYLGVWADAGVITFLFFCCLLIIYLVRALKLDFKRKIFCLSILFAIYIFFASLHSIINQGYFIALFVYLGYFIDKSIEANTLKITND